MNVLMGLNGMGKSTLIQSLLLLRQSYEETGLDQLKLNGSYVDLGNGNDVLYERAEEDIIGFLIEEDDSTEELKYAYAADSDRLEGLTEFRQKHDTTLLNGHMTFLSAYRIKPQVRYCLADEKDIAERYFGQDGEFAVHYLKLFGSTPVKNRKVIISSAEDDSLYQQTKSWLGLVAPGIIPQITVNTNLRNVELRYAYREGEEITNDYRSTNVGFGITYVLPVIVSLLTAEPGELILIENPEAHIHPAGQSHLGRLLSLAASGGVQVLVETHSDHIMNGIRRAVKSGKLSNNDAGVFYFWKNDEEYYQRQVKELVIDKNGKINKWPEGFLDEWDNALLELL